MCVGARNKYFNDEIQQILFRILINRRKRIKSEAIIKDMTNTGEPELTGTNHTLDRQECGLQGPPLHNKWVFKEVKFKPGKVKENENNRA